MRLIDAEAFLKMEIDRCGSVPLVGTCMSDNEYLSDRLKKAPTIEVKPVVHAHWVTEQEAEEINRYDLTYCCSACGHCDWDCTESEGFEYCPNCGAKMDEKENDK